MFIEIFDELLKREEFLKKNPKLAEKVKKGEIVIERVDSEGIKIRKVDKQSLEENSEILALLNGERVEISEDKVDELVGKSENEIKKFLKEVIIEGTKKFDWQDFSLKYNKIFAEYDKEKNVGDDDSSILYEIGNILETYNDYCCDQFISNVYIENGKIILASCGSREYEFRIKDKEVQGALIKFLVKSIMGVCERLNDEDDHLNSLFE